MRLRELFFWLHLAAGLVAGGLIGIMCLTGVALAFEKELVAWAERDARRLAAPTQGVRLGVNELAQRVHAAFPEAKPTNVTVARDTSAAVIFSAGRGEAYYANPYTGEVRRPASAAMGRIMQEILEWHRFLNFTADATRPHGKLVNGIANLTFFFLAVSGLILWWPRTGSWRALRPAVWFTQNASARARDWNWHNTIGFWSAPILIMLTLTALPISFRWAGELTYTLTGTPLPATGPQSSGVAPTAAEVPTPPAEAKPVAREALLKAVQREMPNWSSISFRWVPPADPAKPQAVAFTVREPNTWPRTATTTLQYDPFSGKLLRRDGYVELSAARKVRAWTRFLHTGEAVGPLGQFLAALASLGGCFLVYTGFALAWRRFLPRRTYAR